ncbi:matrilin-4 [Aplysia californica]|uniref:Matrilin-4 n=1 Tax=Aplysia californica TaxID=6500 RepID=A0ABM1VT19_APLCA|nr:matrilin-4 [Aplysia californica]
MFLLEDSRSILSTNFREMISFVKGLVAQFDISAAGTKVALATFGKKLITEFDFGAYNSLAEVEHALDFVHQGSGDETNIGKAISYAHSTLISHQRPGVSHKLIIITNGASSDQAEASKAAYLAREDGVEIIVIGVGR